MYKNIKSHYTVDTNIRLYVNYNSIKIESLFFKEYFQYWVSADENYI